MASGSGNGSMPAPSLTPGPIQEAEAAQPKTPPPTEDSIVVGTGDGSAASSVPATPEAPASQTPAGPPSPSGAPVSQPPATPPSSVSATPEASVPQKPTSPPTCVPAPFEISVSQTPASPTTPAAPVSETPAAPSALPRASILKKPVDPSSSMPAPSGAPVSQTPTNPSSSVSVTPGASVPQTPAVPPSSVPVLRSILKKPANSASSASANSAAGASGSETSTGSSSFVQPSPQLVVTLSSSNIAASTALLGQRQPSILFVNPNKAFFKTTGGVSKHLMINKSADRLAIKIRSSNNVFFRVNPVYSFLECQSVNELEVIRLTGGGGKVDKLQLMYVICSPTDTDPTKLFGLRAKVRSVILPITTTL